MGEGGCSIFNLTLSLSLALYNRVTIIINFNIFILGRTEKIDNNADATTTTRRACAVNNARARECERERKKKIARAAIRLGHSSCLSPAARKRERKRMKEREIQIVHEMKMFSMRANFACRTLNLPASHAARWKDGRKEEDTTKIDDYILIIRTGFISACPSRSRRSQQHTTYEHSHNTHTYTHALVYCCVRCEFKYNVCLCVCAHYCCRPCRSRLCMLSSASETALVAWPAQTHTNTHKHTLAWAWEEREYKLSPRVAKWQQKRMHQ